MLTIMLVSKHILVNGCQHHILSQAIPFIAVDANIHHDSLGHNTFSVTILKTAEFAIQQSQSYCDILSHIQESPSLY